MQTTKIPNIPRAVVLFSGGLDSATVLAIARSQGFDCYALSFDYGQRHCAELVAAARLAPQLGAREHRVLKLDLTGWGGSALTDSALAVPVVGDAASTQSAIPITYVPARNTIFLSLALAWAETLGARTIFAGMNAVDYSGYPDCRPDYIAAFQSMARLATRAGVEDGAHPLTIATPIIHMSKAQIVQTGVQLGVDYAQTISCYQANSSGEACGVCDSCRLRKEGFAAANIVDPTRYINE